MQVRPASGTKPQMVPVGQVKMTLRPPSRQRRMFAPPSGSQRTLPSEVGGHRSPAVLPLVSQVTSPPSVVQPRLPLQSE